jgi:hypothetical protein
MFCATIRAYGESITLTRDEIVNYALPLPPEDRELVAVAIRDSLEPESFSEQVLSGNAFYEELCRRLAAIQTGQTTARDADEVMADHLCHCRGAQQPRAQLPADTDDLAFPGLNIGLR